MKQGGQAGRWKHYICKAIQERHKLASAKNKKVHRTPHRALSVIDISPRVMRAEGQICCIVKKTKQKKT